MVPAGTISSGDALVAPADGVMATNCSPGAAAPGGRAVAGTGIGKDGPRGTGIGKDGPGGTAPAFGSGIWAGTITFGGGAAGVTITGALELVVEF